MSRPTNTDQARFSVSWSALTLALGVISLTALGTLAVVVSIKDVDILSTVALALAVLAFTAQLIVSLAQTQQANEVNVATLSALESTKAATDALLTNQRDQYDRVLSAALERAVPSAVRDVSGSGEVSEGDGELVGESEPKALERALVERINEELRRPSAPFSFDLTVKPERQEALRTLPTREVGEPVVAKLLSLPPGPLATLGRAIADWTRQPREDKYVGYVKRRQSARRHFEILHEAGLIDLDEVNRVNRVTLTEDGMIAAKLLRSPEKLPEWAAALDLK